MKNNERKVFVTKEEIKETWEAIEKSIDDFHRLVTIIYKYSTWATNVSIAILGFILAVLMQLRSQKAIFDIYIVISIFATLGISIVIGFYLRVRYEITINYNSIKKIWKSLIRFLKKIAEQFGEKGADITELNDMLNIIQKVEIKKPKYDSLFTNIPIRLIYTQLSIVLFSLFLTTFYIVKYLFFK